jgi:hypothetical protein
VPAPAAAPVRPSGRGIFFMSLKAIRLRQRQASSIVNEL